MYHIVFYCESETFGGHEKMAVLAHSAIRRHCECIRAQWLISERNERLADTLRQHGLNYAILKSAPQFSPWRNPFRAVQKIFQNAATLRRLSPGLVVVVQGNISCSFDGILSALVARLKCCSYIPMIFRLSEVTKHRLPALADFFWSLLYRVTSFYITIDAEQAAKLRRENPNASAVVVENYVPEIGPLERQEQAKAALGIPTGKKVLAVAGRIVFAHKCQDWLLRELKSDPILEDKYVLFVGDGPDGDALRRMLTPSLRDRFGLIGWQSDLSAVYAAADVLLIPSKVEGVPLVMLEALSYRIPVVGADRDGMHSWLPDEWRFRWGDTAGLKRGIERALSPDSPNIWDQIAGRLAQAHDELRFANQFSSALIHYCEPGVVQ